MLERIQTIEGIGLLHNAASARKYGFKKATIIYADNGRGKSTLATIFRSAATGTASLLLDRKTLDRDTAPKVELRFGSGHLVTFTNGNWSMVRPELLIFDSDFVETNVHSGGEISTTHRKRLLEFALGAGAVSARKDVEAAKEESSQAEDERRKIELRLQGFHSDLLVLKQFEKLKLDPEANFRIERLNKQLVDASRIAQITKKPLPENILKPGLDLNSWFQLLATSLDDIQNDAEEKVRNHLASAPEHGQGDMQAWLSSGQFYDDAVRCPYCAQGTQDNDLLSAYRTYFNAKYIDLKRQVAALDLETSGKLSPSILERFLVGLSTANKIAEGWEEHVAVEKFDFDSGLAKSLFDQIRAKLQALVAQKNGNPTESVGTGEDFSKIDAFWQQLTQMMNDANRAIDNGRNTIFDYLKGLERADTSLIKQEIKLLQLTSERFGEPVIKLFDQLNNARERCKKATEQKEVTKNRLEEFMSATLSKYQASINDLLKKFGASFSIVEMDANFRGHGARSEYALSMRGKTVSLEGGPPKFATALSEGDKRTLAFAFFVACALQDPVIAQRVIVIDDPMCSLDRARKRQTRIAVEKLYHASEQLILLAHDIFFIREVRDALPGRGAAFEAIGTTLRLFSGMNEYSDFASLDVDQECESPYYRHHRLVRSYVAGEIQSHDQVAGALRPLLEGYLHRRFPGCVPKGLTFGQVIECIRSATTPSPLVFAAALVDVLHEINEWASGFHHDTNQGDEPTDRIDPTELKSYADRALTIVHKGHC